MSAVADIAPTLPPGEVITFYSYKGGTGRSMLLSNVGWQLAAAGRRVLLVDWDLEAPGLHRYFGPFLGDDPELREQEGVIEWMTDYWDARLDEPETDVATLVRKYADPRHYVRRLETGNLLAGGIDLLCAGRQDKGYASAVADFDWTRLFEKLHGERLIEAAKEILVGPGGYDYVLIDSRTGVSDTSGFCTVLLADALVVCFTYNNQSVIGASQIARDIKQQAEQRRRQAVTDGRARRFRLFAVPSRIDEMDPERLDRRQKHAWSAFRDLLTDVAVDQQSTYWVSVQIRNSGLFAYEEVLAVCVNRPNDPQSVLGAVTHLTRRLTDDAFTEMPVMADEQRAELREQFSQFASRSGTAVQHSAWHNLTQRMAEPGARDALLHACFPLLVQLFTVSSPEDRSPSRAEIVRAMVLESELTVEEHRMSEMLTSLGVTQRRITDDRQRGLLVADDSILSQWSALATRLEEQITLLGSREKVRQARQAWDAAGRSLAPLRALQGELAQIELADDQRAWFGRPNLQLLQALQELRAMDSSKLGLQDRINVLEHQRERREAELSIQAAELRHESQRAVRSAARFRGATLAGLVTVAMLGGTLWSIANTREQLAQSRAELEAARQEAATATARVDDAMRLRAQEAALRYYGLGTQLVLQAGKPTSRNYDKSLESAIEAFNQAIQADPSLGEAYRGRALARGNQRQRDIPSELLDWAAYYDRVPSLNGRSQLVVRAALEPNPDEALIAAQLDKLRSDAKQPQPDASPQRVAATLEARLSSFPAALQPELRKLIDDLRPPRAMVNSSAARARPDAGRNGSPNFLVESEAAKRVTQPDGQTQQTQQLQQAPAINYMRTPAGVNAANSNATEAATGDYQRAQTTPQLPALLPDQKVPRLGSAQDAWDAKSEATKR